MQQNFSSDSDSDSLSLKINGETKSYANVETLHDLLSKLNYLGKRLAVELNGEIVPKSEYQNTKLNNNDNLEIVVAVGGG